jgi:hypothetical protein
VIAGPLSPDLQGSLVRGRFEVTREAPVDEGLKGHWNDLVGNLEQLGDLGLVDEAERGLRRLFERQLEKHATEAPAAHRKAVAAEMAKALRQAKLEGVGVEELAGAADVMLGDVGGWLQDRLTFTHTITEVHGDVAREGGLNPGQDIAINEGKVKPAAAAVEQRQQELQVRTYAKGGVKLDWKKLFSDADQFLARVDAKAGIRFQQGDFKARVEARVEVHDPIDREGAEVRMSGFAEVGKGSFSGRLEGRATVVSIYDDPAFRGTADLRATLRYTNPEIKASLIGDLRVPLDDAAQLRWSARARVDRAFKRTDRLEFSGFAEGFATGGQGVDTDYGARVGLRVRW